MVHNLLSVKHYCLTIYKEISSKQLTQHQDKGTKLYPIRVDNQHTTSIQGKQSSL